MAGFEVTTYGRFCGDHRGHPIYGIVATPLLAGAVLFQQQWANANHVNQLIGDLKNPDSGVQRNAVEALRVIGKPAVEPLLSALKESDSREQMGAAEVLGRIGQPAVEPLMATLKNPDSHVREGAAEALGKIGQSAVEPLIAALRDPESGIQGGAAEQALGRIGEPAIEPLIPLLGEASDQVRQSAVESLGMIGKPAIDPLIAALNNSPWSSEPLEQDVEAKKVLVIIGEPAVDPLIALLNTKGAGYYGWHTRWCAVTALGEIKDPRAIKPLTASARGDTDSGVRKSAAKALVAIENSPLPNRAARDQ